MKCSYLSLILTGMLVSLSHLPAASAADMSKVGKTHSSRERTAKSAQIPVKGDVKLLENDDDAAAIAPKLTVGIDTPASDQAEAATAEATTNLGTNVGTPLAASTGKIEPVSEEKSEVLGLKKETINKLPESEIPVLNTAQNEKKEAGSNFPRLMLTLGVLVVVLGAATLAMKRWSARSQKGNQNTKIRVLTQHHLGPKKAIAIIQVAGESILIGITDQNISMLKTLSLIDDEIPEQVPRHFDRTLADFDEEAGDDVHRKRFGRICDARSI